MAPIAEGAGLLNKQRSAWGAASSFSASSSSSERRTNRWRWLCEGNGEVEERGAVGRARHAYCAAMEEIEAGAVDASSVGAHLEESLAHHLHEVKTAKTHRDDDQRGGAEEPPWWEQSELVARAAWRWQERLQCAIEGCGDTAELDAVRRCRLTSG